MSEFTQEEMDSLFELGWGFYQFGPNEYQWIKFDSGGKKIAIEGDGAWVADKKKLGIGLTRRTAKPSWSQTFSGRAFDYNDINLNKIVLEDIAWSLAHQNRFNGHTMTITVAQHSIGVAELVEPVGYTMSREQKARRLAALLHDASEAYVGEVVAPLKAIVPDLIAIEKKIDQVIIKRFGVVFHEGLLEEIAEADEKMLHTEAFWLFPIQCETPWINSTLVQPEPFLTKLLDKTWIHFLAMVSGCLPERENG